MFRIRFYTDVLPKPLFGKVVFDNPRLWRSKSMDGSDEGIVAAVAAASQPGMDSVLSRSAELAEASGKQPEESPEAVVFFSGNPEIDVSKGVLRLFKDNK
jgi:hypothetical protein